MKEAAIEFVLNGNRVSCTCDPDMTLLQYLRGTACLKGAKNGCGTGHCGACTVLMNGRAIRSCITKMSRVAGAEILTIEGLKVLFQYIRKPLQPLYLWHLSFLKQMVSHLPLLVQ